MAKSEELACPVLVWERPKDREAELLLGTATRVLGQPVGTVKSNVHRGLRILRGENDERFDS